MSTRSLAITGGYYFVMGLSVMAFCVPEVLNRARYFPWPRKMPRWAVTVILLASLGLDLILWPWVIKSMYDNDGPWRG